MGRTLRIKVIPNSKREEISEGDPLIVRVKAPPEKNKANKAVVKILSKHFKAKISIISGKMRREKIVEID
ncbi:MAG: DUF167 domain-containing protein [bacterium]|nr:DUF167 domain-containing protein [bacterium]